MGVFQEFFRFRLCLFCIIFYFIYFNLLFSFISFLALIILVFFIFLYLSIFLQVSGSSEGPCASGIHHRRSANNNCQSVRPGHLGSGGLHLRDTNPDSVSFQPTVTWRGGARRQGPRQKERGRATSQGQQECQE